MDYLILKSNYYLKFAGAVCKFGFVLPLFFVGLNAFASGKKHSHGAHEHGSANMNVAVEGNKLKIDFDSPAESIYGFEHEAKSVKDKKLQADAFDLMSQKVSELFLTDSSLTCVWGKPKIKTVMGEEAGHSEVEALFSAECAKPLAGTKLEVNFSKHFKKVGKIKVQVVSGEKQSGKTIKKKGTLDL